MIDERAAESSVSMRGQVHAFPGGLVWDMFWILISQRERERERMK